jgi:hypothetical protein
MQTIRSGYSGKVGAGLETPEAKTALMVALSSSALGDADTGPLTRFGPAGLVVQAANIMLATTITTA